VNRQRALYPLSCFGLCEAVTMTPAAHPARPCTTAIGLHTD
jgi:hypothetical protein